MEKTKKTPIAARILACACACFLLAATVIDLLPTDGEERVYENVVRLHVIANSDSEEDQRVKLAVRDAVLMYLSKQSLSAEDKESAESSYRARLSKIADVASKTTAQNGTPQLCRATLSTEYYPARTYGSVTLPEGSYTSLRVHIGAAEGQNWWCVLFPPLCLGLAMAEEDDAMAVYAEEREELIAAGFTPKQIETLTNAKDKRVVVKFRIVELLRSLFDGK